MIDETIYQLYITNLLAGNKQNCFSIVKKHIDQYNIKDFYFHLFQRSMYEVGELWEQNKISVATEHIATAITENLLNLFYPIIFSEERVGKKALVSCSINEYHQIGAKMIADIFELNGWDGIFLGANTPGIDLIKLIEKEQPDVIGLSVSIYFNMPDLMAIIKELRTNNIHNEILVGGQAFRWGGTEILNDFENVKYLSGIDSLEKYIQNN